METVQTQLSVSQPDAIAWYWLPLRILSRTVYLNFYPAPLESSWRSAELYLRDLWLSPHKRAAFIHTVLAILATVLPVFILRKPKILPQLTREETAMYHERLLTHRFYFFRLIGYAVRGHALIAILRDPASRRSLLAGGQHG